MINTELYFNDQLADFDNENENSVAATYASNRLGEIKSRQGDYSNTYNLPLSNPNKRIFENAEEVNSNNSGPYRRATHRVVVEGIEVFRGWAKIEDSKDGYQISAFSGNTDFFEEIAEKKLRDLDLSDLDHERNDVNVAGSWGNTEGYVYSFADYGKYKDLAPNADGKGEIMPEDLYPSMFMHTLIKRIAHDAGYTLQGRVLTNPKFLKQLVPFSNFPLTPDQTYYFSGQKTEPQILTTTPQPIILEEIDDASDSYDTFGFYTSPIKQRAEIKLVFEVLTNGQVLIPKGYMRIKLLSNGQNTTLYRKSFTYENKVQNFNVAIEANLKGGDQIWLEVFKDNTIFAFTALVKVINFEIESVGSLGYDTNISMANTLPDMSQSKFFLDFLNQYGQITTCDTERKILHLTYFDDIEKNEPVDWSNKIDDSERPQVSYRFENYAQANTLTFKVDELPDNGDTRGLITDGKAKIFTIDDETLEREYPAFESEFYLPNNVPAFQGQVITIAPKIFNIKQEAKVKDRIRWKGIWNNADAFAINDAVYRLGNYYICTVANTGTDPDTDAGAKWDAADESDIWDIADKPFYAVLQDSQESIIVKFASGDQVLTKFMVNDNLDWEYVWNNHYRSFAKVIDRTKIVKLLMKLNYSDINQLDFKRPVYIERYGALFYIDIIEQFKFSEVDSTYVTLVRL